MLSPRMGVRAADGAGREIDEQGRAAEAEKEYRDGLQIWAALGVKNPESVPLLDRDSLVALKEGLPT